jgi:diguanylate cyclase (GGDEF)-like protein/PAS domain S-box-containing protein
LILILKDFIFNISLLVCSFVLASQFLVHGKVSKPKQMNKSSLRYITGLYLGVIGVLLVVFGIRVTSETVIDLRHVATVIAAIYGGFPGAVISAVIIAAGRIVFFPPAPSAYIAAGGILLIGLTVGWLSRLQMKQYTKMQLMNLVSLVIVSVTQYINIPLNNQLYWLWGYTWVTAVFGIQIVYYVARIKENFAETVVALHKSKTQYQLVVENSKEVIFQTDPDGKWLFLNPAWEKITGFSTDESIGVPFHHFIHPEDREHNLRLFEPVIRGEKESCEHETRYITKSGGYRWIEVRARLVLDEQGEIAGTSGTLADVTTRKLAEIKAKEMQERLTMIYESASDLMFLMSVTNENQFTCISVNQAYVSITGLSEEQVIGKSIYEFLPEYHASDITKKYQAALNSGKILKYEENVQLSKGSIIVETTLHPIFDEEGKAQYLLGVSRDITSRKVMEQKIEENERRYRCLFDHNPNASFQIDNEGRLLDINMSTALMLGYSREELVGKRLLPFLAEEHVEFTMTQFLRVQRGESVQFEVSIHRKNGDLRNLSVVAVPVTLQQKISGAIGIAQDITEQKKTKELLQKQSCLDGLTGIANRRVFDETIDLWMKSEAPLSVVLFDIDFFKKYNDHYGHLLGDDCLKNICRAVESAVEIQEYLFARYGGEEFALLLPNTELAAAAYMAEQVRASVEKLQIPHAYSLVCDHVTISLGVAARSSVTSSARELVECADIALYQAKFEGKNSVCRYL